MYIYLKNIITKKQICKTFDGLVVRQRFDTVSVWIERACLIVQSMKSSITTCSVLSIDGNKSFSTVSSSLCSSWHPFCNCLILMELSDDFTDEDAFNVKRSEESL